MAFPSIRRRALAQVPEGALPVRDLPLGVAGEGAPDDDIIFRDAGLDDTLVTLAALEADQRRCERDKRVEGRSWKDFASTRSTSRAFGLTTSQQLRSDDCLRSWVLDVGIFLSFEQK